MAESYFTTNSLIAHIKRQKAVPTHQRLFQTADFLAFINSEIKMGIVPHVLSYHEDYFLHSSEVSLVANQSEYNIPYRAIGSKIKDLAYKDSNSSLFEMTKIDASERIDFQDGSQDYTMYYLKGNKVVIVPDVTTASGKLVFFYYIRPSEMVEETRVGVITAINTSTGVITFSSTPSNLTTGSNVDFIQVKPIHQILAFDIAVTATTSTTITVAAADLPTGLAVGDHVATAGECIIPQIPTDLHSLLAERSAARLMEALGDAAGLQTANQKIAELEQKTSAIIDNRTESSPVKIVNRHGFLRQSRRFNSF